jgi:hypothetical protein
MVRKDKSKKGAFFGSTRNHGKSRGIGEAKMEFAVSGKAVPFQVTFYQDITQ